MTADEIYSRAYELQKTIQLAEEKLDEMKEEYDDLIRLINRENLSCDELYLRPKKEPSRHAVASIFKEQFPDFYARCAHPSHAKAVAIMTAIHGNYRGFCDYLRETQPAMFDKFAEITVTDVKKEFTPEEVREMTKCGAITSDAVTSWEVCHKLTLPSTKSKEVVRE